MTVQLQYCLGQENENWQDAGEPISVFKDGLTEPQWSTYTRMIPYDYWTRLRLKYTVTDYQEFSYGTYPYCLIDNLVVAGRPYCANPTKWRVVPETYGGRVIWDKVAAAMSYDIAYQVDGDGDWESVEDVEGYEYTSDSLFFDLTGLQANTTYRVNIKSECSNQWPIAIVTFTTSDFGSFNELMYTFEEGMPADFSVSGAGAANVSVSTEQSFGGDPHSLKYDFVSGSPYPSQALAYVEIGNCLNTRGFNDFLVYFDMYCTDVANTYETVYMQYKAWSDTDGWEENWRSVGTWYTSYDSKGWVERHDSFSIPNELQGTVSKLRFRLIFTDHGSGENTYIDNIRIFPKGSCNNVSGINIVALESTSATFRWNDPNYEAGTTQSVGFTIRYRNLTIPTNTNTGWIEIPVWVDASNPTQQYSITLNELDPSSSYLLSIRAICPGIGYTEWLSPNFNFGTQCQAYKLTDMQPFTEDFDGLLLNPACWTYTTNWNRIYDGHGGHNWCLRSNYNPVVGWNDYIDTPEIELDGNYVSKGSNYLVLRFWTKCSSGDGTGNKVKVLVGNQEVEIYEMPAYGCDQWQQVDLSLSRWLPDNYGSTNTISVRFDHGSDAAAEWFIDDVVITSFDNESYGMSIFDDALSNNSDWNNSNNWYPVAPSYSPSLNVTLMSRADVPDGCDPTVGTLRFGTQGYLDINSGGELTVGEMDIPENKVNVEGGGTLNIGTASFGFDKVFASNEGNWNITTLNQNAHHLTISSDNATVGTANLTAPGSIAVTVGSLTANTVNINGESYETNPFMGLDIYPDGSATIGTLNVNAARASYICGEANITTLTPGADLSVIVGPGGVLNANTITGENAVASDWLLINDGGQVKSANPFFATIEKNISGYGADNVNDRLNWYLIASPIDIPINDPLVPLNGTEFDFDKMDLYRFNPYFSEEWRNEKCTSEGGCSSPAGTYPQGSIYGSQLMVRSTGYLYSIQDDMTVNFSTAQTSSSFSATDEEVEVDINYDNSNTDVKLAGMNLIGNPYTCNAYLKQDDNYIPFYRMNATGDAIVGVPAGTPIKPCEGVFVCCTEPSSTVTFTTTEPAGFGENTEYRMVLLPPHTLCEDQDASPTTLLIGLDPGWNWIAPSVEVIVAAMQDELGSDAVICEEENTRVITPSQMVKVHVAEEGMYELSGRTVPASSVTIHDGNNWIGYTGTTAAISTALTTVFGTSFLPNIGDKIISQDNGFAIYNGTSWEGTLTSLEQGWGYIYVRPSTE